MNIIISICVIIGTFTLQISAEKILESPRITNWGDWGSWERCPNGTYATAAQVKYEDYDETVYHGLKYGDLTALNAIKLYCNIPGQYLRNKYITSSIGAFGTWKDINDCRVGVINGFQLQSESDLGSNRDDWAATNFKMFCAGTNAKAKSDGIELGQKNSWGEYTKKQLCFEGEAVCGIRTQVEPALGSGKDDTSLNNVDLECCKIASPAESCFPSDAEEIVVDCDNFKASSATKCEYSVTTGVSSSSGGSETTSWSKELTVELGFSMSAEFKILQAEFSSSLSTSKTTGYEWRTESSKSFSEQITRSFSFEVPPGKRAIMSQIVGTCGNYKVRASKLIRRDYDKGRSTPLDSYYF